MAPDQAWTLVIATVGLTWLGLFSYALVLAIYRAFFHPLAKVPGPKLYSITQLPYFYHLIRGDWPMVLRGFHDQYGPVVRFTFKDVSFTTPEAWKKIHGHKASGEPNFAKDKRMYRSNPSGAHALISADDADHKRMRKLLSHAFSEKALRNQEHVLKKYIDLLMAKLREKAATNEAIDIVRWYNFATFDLLGDFAFGEAFGCLESGVYHPWVSLIFQSVKAVSVTQVMRREPTLAPICRLLIPKWLIASILEHYQLSESTVKKRVESGNVEREDFMSYILRHNHDDEKGMTVDEMIANATLLIVAGSETTATQLSGTTFYLLQNRSVYDRLVREIRSSFQSEEEITLKNVNNLEYLPAVLNESLRMYPAIPVGFARLTPKGGDAINGYWIPEDTIVSVSHWSAYHSAGNFTEPETFDPERWLGDPRFDGDVKDALQPFATGPRNCIGQNMAHAELRLIIARLFWNFDLELMPGSEQWDQQKIFTLWEKGALNVKLHRVQRQES